MTKFNVCTASDSYKFQHWNMVPKGTEKVYSYFESRMGAEHPYTVFVGLQYLIKEYFLGKIVTPEKIKSAQQRIDAHLAPGAFNINGWNHIMNSCGGKLPVTIKAVPEGMVNNIALHISDGMSKLF